jgi:hypothetical protein
VFVCLGICLGIYFGICPAICHEYVLLEKILKMSWSPRGGLDANYGRLCTLDHNMPCRTLCRLFIHELFLGPLGLHLLVWSELEWSPPFRPMRALTLHGQGPSTLCVKWPLLVYLRSFEQHIYKEAKHLMLDGWGEVRLYRIIIPSLPARVREVFEALVANCR